MFLGQILFTVMMVVVVVDGRSCYPTAVHAMLNLMVFSFSVTMVYYYILINCIRLSVVQLSTAVLFCCTVGRLTCSGTWVMAIYLVPSLWRVYTTAPRASSTSALHCTAALCLFLVFLFRCCVPYEVRVKVLVVSTRFPNNKIVTNTVGRPWHEKSEIWLNVQHDASG